MSVVRVLSYVWERLRTLFDARRSTHAKSEVAVSRLALQPHHATCVHVAHPARKGAGFTSYLRMRTHQPLSSFRRKIGWLFVGGTIVSAQSAHPYPTIGGPGRIVRHSVHFGGSNSITPAASRVPSFPGRCVRCSSKGTSARSSHDTFWGPPDTPLVRVCSLGGFSDHPSTLYSTYPKPVSLLPLSPCRSASTASGTWR